MNQPFHPFIGKVGEVLPQEIRLVDPAGQAWVVPVSAFETLPKLGDSIALLAVPQGGEAVGKSAFAKSLLNELLASE